MLHLVTLGGLGIERDGQPLTGAPIRRRSLALLALLVSQRESGMSRDKLIAFLWPESDARRARNCLKQTTYAIRSALDERLIVSSGGTLRLDPGAIRADLWDFESALAAGRPRDAVTTYRGPFLDGFYATRLPEFERWVDAERQRVERRYQDALRLVAEQAAAAGDRAAAVTWYRSLAAADPLNAGHALALMRALVAAGDVPGALAHGREHAATVQRELGVDASAEVLALGKRLRTEHSLGTPARARPPPTPLARSAPRHQGRRNSDRSPMGALMVPRAIGQRAVALSPGGRAHLLGLLTAAAMLLMLLTLDPGPPAARWSGGWGDRTATVVVLPLVVAGTPGVERLGAEVGELLAARLDDDPALEATMVAAGRGGSITVFDSAAAYRAARDLGARYYVVGRLYQDRHRLEALATMFDLANGPKAVARGEAGVGGTALIELADTLAAQLIVGGYRGPAERLTRAAAASTRSLPALRAYLAGERYFHADSFAPALDAYFRAVRSDTGFALAYYRLSLAADRDGRPELALWGAELAARRSAELSERDRNLVGAYLLRRRGRLDDAERLYRRHLSDYPVDSEAWAQLAELLYHSNPLRGRSTEEARPALERVLALEPDHLDALVHLVRLAALESKASRLDQLLARASRVAGSRAALDLPALHAFGLGDRPDHGRALRDVMTLPEIVPRGMIAETAFGADQVSGAQRLGSLLARAPHPCRVRALGQRMLAQAAFALRQVDTAWTLLRESEACDTEPALELEAIYGALPFLRLSVRELKALRARLSAPGAAKDPVRATPQEVPLTPGGVRQYSLGLVSLRLGDTATARRMAAALGDLKAGQGSDDIRTALSRSLLARMALARSRDQDALRLLQSARWERTSGRSVVEASDRFLRAELLHRLGRPEEAQGWYRSLGQLHAHELVYRAPAQLRLAEILELQGDIAGARAHRDSARLVWKEGELDTDGW